jgi:hypothetical protein
VSKILLAGLAFAAGVGVGLYIADQYAKSVAVGKADSVLDYFGLGGAKPYVDPLVRGSIG